MSGSSSVEGCLSTVAVLFWTTASRVGASKDMSVVTVAMANGSHGQMKTTNPLGHLFLKLPTWIG